MIREMKGNSIKEFWLIESGIIIVLDIVLVILYMFVVVFGVVGNIIVIIIIWRIFVVN